MEYMLSAVNIITAERTLIDAISDMGNRETASATPDILEYNIGLLILRCLPMFFSTHGSNVIVKSSTISC